MKPLSVEMACLLGIQNKIQAVWMMYSKGQLTSEWIYEDIDFPK